MAAHLYAARNVQLDQRFSGGLFYIFELLDREAKCLEQSPCNIGRNISLIMFRDRKSVFAVRKYDVRTFLAHCPVICFE